MLGSNLVYCFLKAAVNFIFAILLFFLSEASFQYIPIGLLAILSSFLGFIRGVAKSDHWGAQFVDIFPALFYLLSGLFLCFDHNLQDPYAFLSLTCFLLLEGFIGLMMANEVKFYFTYWWVSILAIFIAITIIFLIIPGYFYLFIPIKPLIIVFLLVEAAIQGYIGRIERKIDEESQKTIQEIQNDI